MNDPSPFTLLAFLLATAKRRGCLARDQRHVQPERLPQPLRREPHVLSHRAARRAAHPRRPHRILQPPPAELEPDVGGGAAHAAGRRHAGRGHGLHAVSAIQYAEDCIARGMEPDAFLPRFTFFFDISVSLFEEIAKFRAGRRIWARITRERFGARDPRSWRFKFHGQTSGVDLTRQQPLNNIARVTVQAMAGIFGGLQSLHTDCLRRGAVRADRVRRAHRRRHAEHPARGGAPDRRDRPAGRQLLHRVAHRRDGGRDPPHHADVEDAGGMYRAVEQGLVQRMIGESARAFQEKIDSGEQTMVGVNAYQVEEEAASARRCPRPTRRKCRRISPRSGRTRRSARRPRSRARRTRSPPRPRRPNANVFERVVEAAEAGCTHGEICAPLRRELGFGQPLAIV